MRGSRCGLNLPETEVDLEHGKAVWCGERREYICVMEIFPRKARTPRGRQPTLRKTRYLNRAALPLWRLPFGYAPEHWLDIDDGRSVDGLHARDFQSLRLNFQHRHLMQTNGVGAIW